jgi:predicted dehydrogenase
MAADKNRQKIRYAVVGLGHIAQIAVLPAFAHARRNSALTATGIQRPGEIEATQPPLSCETDLFL